MDESERKSKQNLYMVLLRPEKWKTITPIWFNWLGWFLMLGAVGYMAERTNNAGLQIIYGISFIAFFMFITTTISDIMKFKLVKHQTIDSIITLIIAVAVLAVTQLILFESIKDLLKG